MILLTAVLTLSVFAYALLRGDQAIRSASGAGLVIYSLSLLAQVLTHWRTVWPVIAADIGYGLILLALAAVHARRWLYAEIMLCASLLMAHGFLLQENAAPTPVYRAINNSLAFLMLAVLAGAVFMADRRRRGRG